MFRKIAIALVGVALFLGFTATPVSAGPVNPASFGCVDQATGGVVDTVVYAGNDYSVTRWVISNHACTGAALGEIFVSNIHGGYCHTGAGLKVRIEYTTGVHGTEVATSCGDTIHYQVGTEKSLGGPMFRFLVRTANPLCGECDNFDFSTGTS